MGAGHDHPIDLFGRELGPLQGRSPRLLTERDVARLAELLLPDLGPDLARRTPAVQELIGDAGAGQVLGQQRPVGITADQDCGRRIPARRFVGATGQTGTDVGGQDEGGLARGQRAAHGPHARTDGAAEVERRDVGIKPQRGMDGRGIGLVEVGGSHGGEGQRGRSDGRGT